MFHLRTATPKSMMDYKGRNRCSAIDFYCMMTNLVSIHSVMQALSYLADTGSRKRVSFLFFLNQSDTSE